jgi:hypothetical protein
MMAAAMVKTNDKRARETVARTLSSTARNAFRCPAPRAQKTPVRRVPDGGLVQWGQPLYEPADPRMAMTKMIPMAIDA